MTMPKNMQLWVDALRSGDYEQCRGRLESDNSYCCLGVACRVASSHGVELRQDSSGSLAGMSLSSQPAVQKWLGLHHNDVAVRSSKLHSLVILNDRKGLSFEQIADHIEAHWPDYVTKETTNENS